MNKLKNIHRFKKYLYTFLSGSFTQLFISLLLLFIFRPYNHAAIYQFSWKFFLVLVFLSAIFNCNHPKIIKNISIALAIPALICEWGSFFYSNITLGILFLILMITFIFVTTASIIRQVVINARVKLETLRGVVCAYFMVAIGFSLVYLLINIIHPGSFHFSNITEMASHQNTYNPYHLSKLMYFSFVTLLSIGFGDIIPIKDVAQTCVILEGVIGQFYIAILVSRLVGVYSFFEHKLHLVKNKDAQT